MSFAWDEEVQCSEIPADFKEKNVILGIDEAGRGPVLGACHGRGGREREGGDDPAPPAAGPMVYGCAFWVEEENDTLAKLGFMGPCGARPSLRSPVRAAR